jgi:hypothetical protein
MEHHTKDKILMSEITKLLKSVLLIGANAAITEIEDEIEALLICSTCQAALEKRKRLKSSSSSNTDIKVPTPHDRIKRVLTFMVNYSDKVVVLVAGLDACISFAANSDGKKTINNTNFIDVVAAAIKDHGKNGNIMWRGCQAFTTICEYNEEIAANICRMNVHEALATNYVLFADEPRIQMSILWLFDALLKYQFGASRRRIWQSQSCVDLFKTLQRKRDKQMSKAVHADKYAPYKIVIPLSMRAFLRETDGEVLPEDAPVLTDTREFRKRRDFDEHAKFGVIDDDEMKKGEKGLVDTKFEGDGPREWEGSLTYGKSKRPENSKKNRK